MKTFRTKDEFFLINPSLPHTPTTLAFVLLYYIYIYIYRERERER
jgi:hypothetical protein